MHISMGLRGIFARETGPVLVVGAGPAGATAARALALAGLPVRLLDRSGFPRNKPCGGAISIRVLERFPYLESALGCIGTHRVARLHLEGPDGTATTVESDAPAVLTIRRVEFDALLVSLAVEAGVELTTGADVVQAASHKGGVSLMTRDGRRFEAPVVVAADGVNSVVARRLGLNQGWAPSAVALDMMEETPREALRDADPSTLWVAYGYRGDGYAYLFPKREHVNVGIGYVLSYYREALDKTHRAPYELQHAFVDTLRARGVIAGRSVRGNFTPFLIPVGGPLREPGRGRVLLVGDAGGFVNAFTAEGIYYAMVSGELAAHSVVDAYRRDRVDLMAGRYADACRREIGAELRDAVLVQKYLFGDRRRVSTIVRGIGRRPAVTRAVLDYAMGRRTYRAARRQVLARLPLFAARMFWEGARLRA